MPPKKNTRGKSAAKKDDEIEVEQEEEEKQTRKSNRSKSTKKEEPASEEEEEKPKAKRGAKAGTKKETPKKGGSKIAAKVAGKAAKKDQDDDEEEEEDEKPTKAPAKRGRKSAKKDEDEKPAAKSPAKRGRKSTKKKDESEEEEEDSEEEDSEEEEQKPKAPAKRGRKSTKKEEEAEKVDSKAKTTRGKRGARGQSQNKESEEAGGGDEKEKKQKTGDTGKSSTEVDSEVEINVGVRVFKKPGWIYDRYIEEDDNDNPNIKKFFKIQVLDNQYSKHQNHFYTYVRWGKVGEKGEWTLRGYFNKNRACQIYDEKIAEKMKYIKLNQANAAKKTAMQTETPAQTQPEPVSQINASTQDTANATQSQAINGTAAVSQENNTEAPKTAIEEEKPHAKEVTEQKTMEEEKPKTEEPSKAMQIEQKEEIKEQNSSQINRDKIDCPVDSQCPLASTTEVYIKDNEIFDTKYNASDVKKNTNHFYLFQILRNKKDPSKFYVFYRYGRVGLPGEWVLRGVFTEEQAVAAFRAKQEEKKVQNKYTALEMSYMKDDPELLTKLFSEGAGKSKLKKQVAEFIQLIFDFKMMNTQMEKAGYDPKKLPLGKLSLNMINQGFKLLSELSEAIKNNADEDKIQKLCSEFYTVIPQNVGWKNMNTMVIRTNDEIKEKLEFLDSLRQIQAAYQMVHGTGDAEKTDKAEVGTNPIDENYEKLKCDIDPVDPNSEEYKKISQFIDATKESYQVEIMEMFKINKHGSEENFRKDLDNHVMLWHGSRLTNFVGILSQGLRIAPPEAPVSGYRLGKGIYLADMISKSVPYCYASASNDVFCIMVCDAALGNINEKLHDDFYAGNLPAGKHSTKALGHVAPPVSSYVDFEDGIKIPQGKPENTEHNRSSFQHNEFIVYNVNQVQIRYLLKMKQKRGRGLFG